MSSKSSNNSSSVQSKQKASEDKPSKGLRRIEKRGAITEFELPANGLRVLLVRMPNTETVTTSIVYKVGSRHERTGETGLAHMLEHMLFKPTAGTGMKWKDLENKGAYLNATTWLDRTLYYFTLPKAYLGDMLSVEADRMRNILLTDAEFLPERANVLSEYQMYNTRPEMALEWHMTATAFQVHGYHHDTIGFKHDIEKYTTASLRAFYDRYYWPRNATLIVAGDVREAELDALVLEHFSTLPNAPEIEPDTRVEENQEGLRRVTLARPTKLRLINFAWKAPAFSSPDWLPLMMGLTYLTHGETSPLYSAIVGKGLGTTVSTHLFPTHDPYLAFASVYACEHVAYSKIEHAVNETVQKIASRPLPQQKLALAKESLRTDELFSRDGTRAVALALSEHVAAGDWRKFLTTENDIDQVTALDIQRALQTYLVPHRCTIGTLEHHEA